MGLTVGVIGSGQDYEILKRQAYAADITYGTNNEFGFDYLRDNMAFSIEQKCSGHSSMPSDEVDSILLMEGEHRSLFPVL